MCRVGRPRPSLYCRAGGEARCGADATVPLHLRAWERSDGTLTIDGGDGERRPRSETTAAWALMRWRTTKFLRRGHRAGLVHDAREGPR